MTDIDVAALRAAAEGATPGPWFSDDLSQGNGPWPTTGLFAGDPDNCFAEFDHKADAQFAAAANPAVVLELLDRLAAAEGAVARVRAVAAAGDVRTLDDFQEPCVMLDDLRAAIDNEEQP